MASSDSRTIPWVIQPQTAVKHQLLRSYMATWMKIFWRQQEIIKKPAHLIYVDGFAGPGEYWRTEEKKEKVDGSPIIVGKIANDLIKNGRKLDIVALDAHKPTAEYLAPLLSGINTKQQTWEVIHEDFSTGVRSLINKLATRLGHEYPAFFFIDPFGYSGFPMKLLAEILRHKRTEVFVTFMTYDICRFIDSPDAQGNMLELFGTNEYKQHNKYRTPNARVNFITSLYRQQLLKTAQAEYVIGFRINTPDQDGRARFFLFHASNHKKALRTMKDAMASQSDREFTFEAIGVGEGNQLDLYVPTPMAMIEAQLLGHIEKKVPRKLDYSEIEDWGYMSTAGIAKNIKTALINLENAGKILIHRLPRQRLTTVTDGASVELISGASTNNGL